MEKIKVSSDNICFKGVGLCVGHELKHQSDVAHYFQVRMKDNVMFEMAAKTSKNTGLSKKYFNGGRVIYDYGYYEMNLDTMALNKFMALPNGTYDLSIKIAFKDREQHGAITCKDQKTRFCLTKGVKDFTFKRIGRNLCLTIANHWNLDNQILAIKERFSGMEVLLYKVDLIVVRILSLLIYMTIFVLLLIIFLMI